MKHREWNAYIGNHAPQALFQSWEWGEVEKKLGHKVWRLEWPGAIAQVVKVEAKRGTFLHVRHGPIVTRNWSRVIEDLHSLALDENAWFVRISPRVQKFSELGFVPAPIHAMDAEVCWVLDLDKSENELLANMRKTTRYEIRHATGVTVTKSRDIKRFMTLYNETSARHAFVQHTGIVEEYTTLDCQLYVASHGGKDLAAAIIVYFGDEAIYHHGASIPSRIPASYLIQWEAIREARKRGMKVYNFWGIAPENSQNHPWKGLTVFKTGFGGREVRFIHAQDYPVSPLYIIPKTIESIRKRLKGY